MIRLNMYRINGQAARMPRWAAWLTMAVSVVVGVTLFLLAASLALILIPIVLVAGAIFMWRLKRKLKQAGFQPGKPFPDASAADPREIVDVEYRIIEQSEPPRR